MYLYTNRPEFRNDICEEIRLFLPLMPIDFIEVGEDCGALCGDGLVAYITHDEEYFIADVILRYAGNEYPYRHETAYRAENPMAEKRYLKRCLKVAVFRALRSALPATSLPWGSLTGIRPTSLLRELILTEGKARADEFMLNEFDVAPEKLALANEIVSVQQDILGSIRPNEVDVYIGIPFCRTRCLYCSFASQLRTAKTDMRSYLDALKTDISNGARLAQEKGLKVRALYLGGGTPTVLTADELSNLIHHALDAYGIGSGVEFTVEAGRPDTITAEKLGIIKKCGATRISVNPQTMCNSTLKAVGRDHTAEDIEKCYLLARDMGFDSINMDLIAGLPGENADDMSRSIEKIIELEPDCLTVHTLAIKRSSRLKEHLDEFKLPDVHDVESMTAIAGNGARRMGMLPYYMYRQKYMAGNMENVGYSKPDKVCVYNIDMMEDALSIIAHGAGAMNKRVFAGEKRIERVPNPKDISTYIEKLARTHEQRREMFSLQ